MNDKTRNPELLAAAVSHHQAGRLDEAEALYRSILASDPAQFDALTLLGTIHLQRGQREEGVRLIGQSLEINPKQPVALNNRGNALLELGRPDEALASFDGALALNPGYADAWYNRGNALQALKRPGEAAGSYERDLALRPDHADAWLRRGNILQDMNRPTEALASYDRALALRPDLTEAHYYRGVTLHLMQRPSEAVASYERAIALKTDHVEAHYNLGIALLELQRPVEAIASYDRALALRPGYADAHSNRGNALQELHRLTEAIASYDRALALQPDHVEANYNRGVALQKLERVDEALANFERALALRPDYPYLPGILLHCRMHCCDWPNFDASCSGIMNSIGRGNKAATPFAILAIPTSPEQQQHCAQIFIRDRYPPGAAPVWRGERYVHDRIRIGYFSTDYRNHATAHLMAELLERHDRSKFEIIGFSYGPPADDPWRRRLERTFDHFLDVRTRTDREIAALVRERETDIIVDLKGHTQDSRIGVFALRPAPLQVNYLGYPGTLGAGYMDYLIADATVIPPEHAPHYDEKIVYLPHSYQVNNSTKTISDRAFTRAELGLPENGFVFCCFNNNYKITPDLFDVWMRLLRAVPGSALWLLEGNPAAPINLRREAANRGVSGDRLVFAPSMDLADHLARHRLADLFLDTFYCNAHTTASDALWAGLPVLTCLGKFFAARVAASQLKAIGLPELITHTHEEYEALALELATRPDRLAALREKLAANRTTQPLFDTARFTRDFEKAYRIMYDRHQKGLGPDHILVT